MEIGGWEQLYRKGERGKEDDPTILLVETVTGLSPGRALDLACGTGRNALFLSEHGWATTALDGSQTAVDTLHKRAGERGLEVQAAVVDLTAEEFTLAPDAYDLIVIAYYLQRDLFAKAKTAVRRGGRLLAIVHTPEASEAWTSKRALPGELRAFFSDWEVQHHYEGPSRDPAHRRPVAELVARKP